jgi:hypothetical protein
MTPTQLKTLHATFARLKALRPDIYDDAWLRLAVRNAGQVMPDCTGHVSTKSLTNTGMENVMAIIEQRLDEQHQAPGTYWRDTVARRTGYASRRQVHAIHELAPAVPYPLESICLKFSDGRHRAPEKLTPDQAQKLIEMMKNVASRQTVNHEGHQDTKEDHRAAAD